MIKFGCIFIFFVCGLPVYLDVASHLHLKFFNAKALSLKGVVWSEILLREVSIYNLLNFYFMCDSRLLVEWFCVHYPENCEQCRFSVI